MSAKTVTLTDADNKSSVTLRPGDTLLVRLSPQPGGYLWHAVLSPTMPLSLSGHEGELCFSVAGPALSYARRMWLKLLLLRPFEQGVTGAELWEVSVEIPGASA